MDACAKSGLLSQIRSGLRLKPVPPKPPKPPKPEPLSGSGGGDLMGDLFAKLNVRRKGVAYKLGPPQEKKKTSVDSFMSGSDP